MFTKTLSENARQSLAVLGKGLLSKDTYLAGGSALALYFGHRLSVDLDFFTKTNFSASILEKKLKKAGSFKTRQALAETLLGSFDKIQFSLFYYQHPLLFPTTNYLGIRIADPRDIAAMKIATVMDRGLRKDFIDLFFLCQKGINLDKCMQFYDRKYRVLRSNLYNIITSLSYFVDAENSEMPVMLKKANWKEIKKFFEFETVRLGKKYLES